MLFSWHCGCQFFFNTTVIAPISTITIKNCDVVLRLVLVVLIPDTLNYWQKQQRKQQQWLVCQEQPKKYANRQHYLPQAVLAKVPELVHQNRDRSEFAFVRDLVPSLLQAGVLRSRLEIWLFGLHCKKFLDVFLTSTHVFCIPGLRGCMLGLCKVTIPRRLRKPFFHVPAAWALRPSGAGAENTEINQASWIALCRRKLLQWLSLN